MLVAAVALAACRARRETGAGADAAASAGPPSASKAPAPTSAGGSHADAHPELDQAPSAEGCRTAMALGRQRTREKDYAAAALAFERAGTLCEDMTPRAERGYALLLSGKTEEARATLAEAWLGTYDPATRGAIAFNLGLAHDARKQPEEALRWFFLSDAVRPSRAAKARIEGKSFCPAVVDATLAPASTHAGWGALFGALSMKRYFEGEPAPSDARARSLLCDPDGRSDGGACTRLLAGQVDSFPPGMLERRLVVEAGGGRVAASVPFLTDAKPQGAMVCDVPATFETRIEGRFTHAITAEVRSNRGLANSMRAPCTNTSDTCQTDCFVTDFIRRDAFFDRATLARVATIEQVIPCGAPCGQSEVTANVTIGPDDVLYAIDDTQTRRSFVRLKAVGAQLVLTGPPSCQREIALGAP